MTRARDVASTVLFFAFILLTGFGMLMAGAEEMTSAADTGKACSDCHGKGSPLDSEGTPDKIAGCHASCRGSEKTLSSEAANALAEYVTNCLAGEGNLDAEKVEALAAFVLKFARETK